MRIDIEYIREFLDIVLEHDQPDFNLHHQEIRPLWDGDDESANKLIFHMEILEDQRLIESSGRSSGIGFKRLGDGNFIINIIALRLTANGHQFASDLAKPGVFDVLKTSFKNAGPTELVKIVFSLGGKALEKKLENLIE